MFGKFLKITSRLDSVVQQFLNTNGASNFTALEISALNNLVVQKKLAGTWSKQLEFAPLIGGTQTSCAAKLVWQNASTITWAGTPIFDSTGVTSSNILTDYGNTGFIINPANQNNFGMACYVRNNFAAGNKSVMGAVNASPFEFAHIYPRRADNNIFIGINQTANTPVTVASVGGYYEGQRTASNVIKGWRDSTLLINSNQVSSLPPTFSIFILGRNAIGSLQVGADANISFYKMTTGLTDSERAADYGIDRQFLSVLGKL